MGGRVGVEKVGVATGGDCWLPLSDALLIDLVPKNLAAGRAYRDKAAYQR